MTYASRKAVAGRLRHTLLATREFHRALGEPSSWLIAPLLRDRQVRLWLRLRPRLERIQREAADGCLVSLGWLQKHLEDLGYVLAQGELLEVAHRELVARSAEEAARDEERLKVFRRERDAYQAACRGEAPGT